MSKADKHFYEFGHFRFDTEARALFRGEELVSVTPKAIEMLRVLVERRGEIVTREELIRAVWPETYIEEGNLHSTIFMLRRALGEEREGERYIETVPRRGYRFVAEVIESGGESAEAMAQERVESNGAIEQERTGETETKRGEQSPTLTALPPPPVSSSPSHRSRSISALAVVLAALAAAAIYWWNVSRARPGATAVTAKSIAVLPFKILDQARDEEYLGVGMADALITRLGNLRQVVVRPTSAVRKYSGDRDPVAAGRELKVESVLEGSIRRSGERVRVTVQLISVRDQAPLWAEKFDELFTDIFRVEDSISEKVAEALALKLGGEERKLLAKRYTADTEAYQFYLRGRYFWNKRAAGGMNKALQYFEQATRVDPNYALAYVGLADCYLLGGGRPEIGLKGIKSKAQTAASKAIEIDEQLAEAHTSLAFAKLIFDWDRQAAAAQFKRAIELNPNYPTAHQWYAFNLAAMGRLDEALAEIWRAQELDPLSLIINADVGEMLTWARQYDQAIAQCRKTIELDPTFTLGHFNLGLAYGYSGRHEAAIAELRQAIVLSESGNGLYGTVGYAHPVAGLGYIYAASGNRGEAQKIVDRLKIAAPGAEVAPYEIAIIYAGLGEKDQALAWLEKAYEQHHFGLLFINIDPPFLSLHSDPRFADLVRRVGLQSIDGRQ